jgi:sugar-specific transcriptional regulator TrmB
MYLFEQLKEFGLHNSEIKVYLFLLENGVSSPKAIAKGTGLQRTNSYSVLKSLKDKGLIEQQNKNKVQVYVALDPQALVFNLEQKKEAVKLLLPDLRNYYLNQKNKPKVRFFEGWKEVKNIYDETLQAKKIVGIGSTLHMSQIDSKFTEYYQKELAKKKIIFYDILTSASKITLPQIKILLGGLHQARFLPSRYKDLPTDILLWEQNIALVTFKEPVFGTIITNDFLTQTFGVIFQVLWETLGDENSIP